MSVRSDEAVRDVAEGLRDYVTGVEASIATTRNHYGDYMGLFSRFTEDVGQAQVLAKALVLAGANRQGVADALRVSY